MKKFFIILVVILIAWASYRVITRQVNKETIGEQKPASVPTLTTLPALPEVPLTAKFWSDEKKQEFISGMIDIKLSTYPQTVNRNLRAGKFAGTGLQPKFDLREDQLKTLADNYDLNTLTTDQANSGKILKQYNPNFKLFLYFDSGLQPDEYPELDSILKNHPDWLLKDNNDEPIRSASGTLSNAGEYWADPANREWQEFFAAKVNKALKASGNIWDGVLLDQFFGRIENYTRYAGANAQTTYKTDADFQAAQIAFLKRISELITVPVIPNVDGTATVQNPEFFLNVAKTAGGAESEILPFENDRENDTSFLSADNLKTLIETIQQIPRNKYVRLNSHVSAMAGNIDRTIYAYCTYLLVADPSKPIYWTFKEGDSSIPHFWYKEFDLDLGKSLSAPKLIAGQIWIRQYEKAQVLVNPPIGESLQYNFSGVRFNVLGEALNGFVTLPKGSGMLLFNSKP